MTLASKLWRFTGIEHSNLAFPDARRYVRSMQRQALDSCYANDIHYIGVCFMGFATPMWKWLFSSCIPCVILCLDAHAWARYTVVCWFATPMWKFLEGSRKWLFSSCIPWFYVVCHTNVEVLRRFQEVILHTMCVILCLGAHIWGRYTVICCFAAPKWKFLEGFRKWFIFFLHAMCDFVPWCTCTSKYMVVCWFVRFLREHYLLVQCDRY